MGRILVVATAGAGGDLQPLVAAALALRERGHEMVVLGDGSVRRALDGLDVATQVLPPELELGPALIGAIRDAMEATGGDLSAAGPIVRERMTEWARGVATPVAAAVRLNRPDVVATSLFGVEAVDLARPPCPWAVVNSTFYVGPNPPRPLEADFGPRAVPLIEAFAALLDRPDLVLHATDPTFDLSYGPLPERHRYVGPLGIWEPPAEAPAYLDDTGDPWALVSISSQLQDDLPLAEAASRALAEMPLRVLLTIGPDHSVDELADMPPGVRVENVVSHAAVLERAALLVGHAGHGSVMKALWFGCPMVLVPWGRDQPGVAARAQALGVARVVPRELASPETIGAAATEALNDGSMRAEAARHSERLRSTDPPAEAAVLIEGLL